MLLHRLVSTSALKNIKLTNIFQQLFEWLSLVHSDTEHGNF